MPCVHGKLIGGFVFMSCTCSNGKSAAPWAIRANRHLQELLYLGKCGYHEVMHSDGKKVRTREWFATPENHGHLGRIDRGRFYKDLTDVKEVETARSEDDGL